MKRMVSKWWSLGSLRRLHQSRSGTAMTEFAVTLPIYILFMIGILNLYNIHQEVLLSEQRASAELWEDAVGVQSGFPVSFEMTPGSGAISSASHYSSVGDFLSVANSIDSGTAAGGMYAESGLKVSAADLIPNVNVDPEPEFNLNQVVCDPSFTSNLMNDRMLAGQMDYDNFAGIASSVLNATGARPALGAGIRYGIVGGIDDHQFGSDSDASAMGMTQAFGGDVQTDYSALAPTRPVDRIGTVGLARLEIGPDDGFSDTANFGWTNIGSGADSIGSCP